LLFAAGQFYRRPMLDPVAEPKTWVLIAEELVHRYASVA
jgi:hypothetical protein